METGVVEYNVTNAMIEEYRAMYMGLVIDDIENKEQVRVVHDARMVIKNKRVEVEKRRKDLKADALEWGRKVDSEAKRIFGLLAPIETHLMAEEDKVLEAERIRKEAAERIERARREGMLKALAAVGCIKTEYDVAAWTDEEYHKALAVATEAYKAEQARIAEEARLKKEQEQAEAAARKAEAERLEQIRSEQKAEADRLAAERKAIEDEKAAIAKQKADEEARINAEKAAKERAEREAKEAAERAEKARIEAEKREKRAEEMRPDKEKLRGWVESLPGYIPQPPALKTEEAQAICHDTMLAIAEVLKRIHERIEAL